jgi:putative tryptophan/tyrosine transport system substrate-binding protein
MKRREFIAGLGGAAAAWPLAARAQKPVMPVVGLLSGVSFEDRSYALSVAEIREGLQEVGFVEGQNVLIEYRSADGHPERVKDLADDLVRRQVAVIVAIGGSNTALAAKAATPTIPIVFAAGGDALENGLVKNFNKPEANVTGMSFNTRQMAPKRLDLLRTLLPQATLFGYLDNVATASEMARQQLVASARSAGAEIVVFYAGTADEIDSAFETMVQQRVQGVVVSTDAYLITRQEQIISLAKRRNVAIEISSADGHFERLPVLADNFARRKVALIFASSGVAAMAGKEATRTHSNCLFYGRRSGRDWRRGEPQPAWRQSDRARS